MVGMSTESQELVTEQTASVAVESAPAAPRSPRLLLGASALASAGLLWLSYFPVNAGWVAWIALVPLLCLVRATARARWIYPFAWLAGLAFFVAAVQWLRHADDRELL